MQQNKGLVLQDVSFSFTKNEDLFFASINVSLQAGKIHFVQGRNGSGKSTFFKMLQADMHSTEYIDGLFILNGVVYVSTKPVFFNEYRTHVKQVVQQVQQMLIMQMTVAENIAFTHMKHYPFLKKFSTNNRADSLLQAAGITPDQLVYTLSGGQKQLLAILMSTYNAAEILLLDEPTAALDDTNAALVMDTIAMLAQERNIVVIIVCHDTEIVKKYCSGKLITIKKEPAQTTRIITVE